MIYARKLSGTLVAVAFLSGAAPASGNPVLEWSAMMMSAIRIDNSGPTLKFPQPGHSQCGHLRRGHPGALPGEWQRTPPFFRPLLTPQSRYVETFCSPILTPFLPKPPPALDSEEYARAFEEVKRIGGKNSPFRTAEQSLIAVFWSDFSYTAMPPGHWHEIAADISRNHNLSIPDSARFFALLGLAQADAAILCWEAKFQWNLWRPVTAIRRADEDGNPLTHADPDWDHYLGAPPFPAYTSGHSTFSQASGQVFKHFFGTDALAFTTRSDSLPGVVRAYDSVQACVDEVGMSRIYGGIHFQFDNTEGKRTGRMIGDYVSRNFLLANDALPLVRLEELTNGAPLLRVHGRIGQEWVLEWSHDLYSWQGVSTNIATAGGVVVRDLAARDRAMGFYRVRE